MNNFIQFIILEILIVFLPFSLGILYIKRFGKSAKWIPIQAQCISVTPVEIQLRVRAKATTYYQIWVQYKYNGEEIKAPFELEFSRRELLGTKEPSIHPEILLGS